MIGLPTSNNRAAIGVGVQSVNANVSKSSFRKKGGQCIIILFHNMRKLWQTERVNLKLIHHF